MKNAGDVLERILQRHHHGLRAAAKAVDQEHLARLPPLKEAQPPLPEKTEKHMSASATSRQDPLVRQRRLTCHQEVLSLADQGLGPKAIGRQVGLTRQTVARWLRAGTFPERAPSAPRPMMITAYETYLRQRWEAGCQNGRQLWRELQEKGFTGGHETVRRLLIQWRTEPGRSGPPRRQRHTPSARQAPPPRVTRPLSPRQARWLLLKPASELKPEQQIYLEHFGRACPEIQVAKSLIVDFIQLVRERHESALALWLSAAEASPVPELVEFAKGLVRDRAAVEGALRYMWSNGITEGHVNRLKMIKRMAYGRASFALLRQRVLAQG